MVGILSIRIKEDTLVQMDKRGEMLILVPVHILILYRAKIPTSIMRLSWKYRYLFLTLNFMLIATMI
jgi:hypothetical protein